MLGQLFALSARGIKVLQRDSLALLLLFAAPFFAAIFVLFFSDRRMYDLVAGSSEKIMLSSAMLVFLVMLLAGFAWAREFRKEAAIIDHERQASLRLWPYTLSKGWMVALFALYQALVWTVVHFSFVNVPGGLSTRINFFITLASVALVGGMLGLVASALSRSEGGSAALVFIFVLPQFLFSGVFRQILDLNPTPSPQKWINPSQVAFEALTISSRHLQVLNLNGCLGGNLFTECNFPGIRRFYENTGSEETLSFRYQDLVDEVEKLTPEQIMSGDFEPLYFGLLNIIDRQVRGNIAHINAENLIKDEINRYGDIITADLSSRWLALWIIALILMAIFAGVVNRKEIFR
jgi:hypothetical protein